MSRGADKAVALERLLTVVYWHLPIEWALSAGERTFLTASDWSPSCIRLTRRSNRACGRAARMRCPGYHRREGGRRMRFHRARFTRRMGAVQLHG
jgi:hypothetical protein